MIRTSIVSALCVCALLSACGGGSEQDQPQAQEPRSDTALADTTTAGRPAEAPGATAADNEAWAGSAALNQAEVQQVREAENIEQAASSVARKAVTAPAAPIYRFFNNQTGAHLLTKSIAERDAILNTLSQFRYEGPVFAAWQTTDTGLAPVYRFANTRNGTHVFTISETERNHILATMPWMALEGAAYYAARTALPGTTALYRFYHLQRGFHFYTASVGERDHLIANLASTYRYEGVAYYVNATVGSYSKALASFAGKVNAYGNVNAAGESARFGGLRGLVFDPAGTLYAVDSKQTSADYLGYPEIRKVSPNGTVSSFVGSWNSPVAYRDGVGSGAALFGMQAITFDANGMGYTGDNHTVRTINPTGVVTTIAGDLRNSGYVNGQAQAARFLGIRGIARDSSGNIFVSECYTGAVFPSSRIRKVTPAGVVSTFAGAPTQYSNFGYADGQGTDARFRCPGQIAVDASDNLYVADEGNHRIRKITPSGLVTTLAGQGAYGVVDGEGTAARFDNPYALTVDMATGNVYTADWDGYTVRRITPSGTVTTIVGSPYARGVFFGALPAGLAEVGGLAIRNGRLYIASLNGIYWTNL